MSLQKCIYCGSEFDRSRGEGDHILFAALGEFQDDVRFRNLCASCNSRIGRLEQQIVQSGPEGFYRSIVRPSSARLINRRGIGRQRGALGAPGPIFTANMGDHTELVQPSSGSPCDAMAIDQIVMQDERGKDHPLQLYPGMSVEQLKNRIARLDLGKIKVIRLHCDEQRALDCLNLVKAVFPDLHIEEESVSEAGSQKIRGRVIFTVKEPYFQALAKMAFHYYLSRSRRGYHGDEPMFDDLRYFVLNGGDVDRFFSFTQRRFRPPMGEAGSGWVVTPKEWCHLLAVDEAAGSVVVYLQLFLGPGCLRPPCYVTLGKLPTELAVLDSFWGHAYVYDSHMSKSRYCGRVLRVWFNRL